MKPTHLFVMPILLTVLKFLQAVMFTSFSRVPWLDGNVCPGGSVIKETRLVSDMTCSILCSEHSSCRGFFYQQEAMICLICSATYYTINDTPTSHLGDIFYKRDAASTDIEDKSEISVYWLLKQLMTWHEAKVACEKLRGQLVSIKSAEEQEYIAHNVLNDSYVGVFTSGMGIGGSAHTFKWLDNSSLSAGYTYWQHSQPYFPEVDTTTCIVLLPHWNYKWFAESCNVKLYGLCEFK